MAKPTTPTKSKGKKLPPVKFEEEIEDISEPVPADEFLALDPKPFSDSLKRIGEQAKDWDEGPQVPRREPTPSVAPAAKPAAAAKPPRQRAATPWTGWAALALLTMLVAQVIWLNWRAMALTQSLRELNANVKQLTEKVATWSDAETRATEPPAEPQQ